MSSLNSIVFINKEPQFSVDFDQFIPSKKCVHQPLSHKVLYVALRALEYVKFFFISLATSVYLTIVHSGSSFQQIVLGLNYQNGFNFRPPRSAPEIVFRISVWVFGLTGGVFSSTFRLFYKKINQNPSPHYYLGSVIEEGINVAHFRTKELVLDAKHVPEEIKVDSLASIFQEINFYDKEHPTYMAPSCLKEDAQVFTKDELKKSLNQFINNVNKRIAFLGTPPSYDAPRLVAFYQQIENAVRLSLFHTHEKIETYKQTNGDPESYVGNIKKEYKDLLDARSRIAIDLAIAGIHCGARYMGDAMTIYQHFHGDELFVDQSLEESIVEILANKRKEIALAEIQNHLGNDTHDYASYMGNLGKIVAIPGTENVIEHLSTPLDVQHYLTLFMRTYNVDMIIQTIRDKLHTSQLFREKVQEWLKGQIGEWKKDHPDKVRSIADEIRYIMEKDLKDNSPPVEKIKHFAALIEYLKEEKKLTLLENSTVQFKQEIAVIKNDDNFNQIMQEEQVLKENVLVELDHDLTAFIEALFLDKSAKKFIDDRIKNSPGSNKNRISRNDIAVFLKKCVQDPEMVELVKHILVEGDLKGKELVIQKLNKAYAGLDFAMKKHNIYGLDLLVFLRNMEGDLEGCIQKPLDDLRESAFINKFPFELTKTDKNGELKFKEKDELKLIEWILVSQNILLPQKVRKEIEIKIEDNSAVENAYHEFISTLDRQLVKQPLANLLKEFTLNKVQGEEKILNIEALIAFSYAIQKGESPGYLEELANKILEKCPSLSHQNRRYRFDKLSGTDELLTEIFNRGYGKNPNLLIAAAKKIDKNNRSYYPAWKKIVWIQATEFLSVIFKNLLFKIIASITAIFFTFGMGFALLRSIISLDETDILEDSPLGKIRSGLLGACVLQSLNFGYQTWNLCNRLSHFFHYISTDAIKERAGINKPLVHAVWKEATSVITLNKA